jgi:predicted dehydrogenase
MRCGKGDAMASNEVKVGIIGAGGLARSVHLPSLAEMPDVRIAAVCDLVAERAVSLAQQYAVPQTYVSYHEMFAKEELDAVFVLVEPANLYHVAWHTLDAGLHAFMEKPPGVTAMQARGLARKAAETGRFLQVGFNRRHIPVVRRALEIVRARTRITQVEGMFIKYGDAAFDRGSTSAFVSDTIHAIDLVRWIAGGTPVAAALVEERYDDAVPNAWNGVIRFDTGVTGILKSNYRTGGRVHRCEVHGPGASAFLNLGMGAEVSCTAEILVHEGESSYSLAAAGAARETVLRLDGAELAGGAAFHRQYGFLQEDRHFIDCVLGKGVPEPDIADAVLSIELAEHLLASRI